MYTNRIEVSFDAGHRLLNYPGKCASPHGHSFRAEVLVFSEEIDDLGLALDFGELKGRCKAWIDEHWDHAFLLNDQDLDLVGALGCVPEAKLYLFKGRNPSAEAMAYELYQVAERFGWRVRGVRIWESSNQFAEYMAVGASIPFAPATEVLA